jgi:predicted nucleic acid-binding protein
MDRLIVLPYDAPTAQHWAEVTAHRRRIGRPIECGDAWIGTTAVRHGIPLVTHNVRHYQDIPGLKVISRADSQL